MCDLSGSLVAWLDRELSEDDAAEVRRHVQTCMECQCRLNAYKEVSGTFGAYCEAAVTAKLRRGVPLWVPVLSGAVVMAVAAAALFLFFPRVAVVQRPLRTQAAAVATPPTPTIVREAAPDPIKRIHHGHAVAPVRVQDANRMPPEPAIQITIPAEALFPPGAVPEGVNFVADVSIAADGSARQLRLPPD
jgi:anti-sigma factor RsiW